MSHTEGLGESPALRVDWFEATVELDTHVLLAYLALFCTDDTEEWVMKKGKGQHGYLRSTQLIGPTFECTVLDLGNDGYPHVRATGQNADAVRRVLHGIGCAGRASRVDIACDSLEGWTTAERRVLDFADTHPKTQIMHMGDFHRAERGRTYYLGAPTSERRVRIYEKGIQLGLDPQWVRVELQLRPNNRAAKGWAFRATLPELANSSRTFVAVRALEGLYVPPLFERPGRYPIHALAHQYGRILKQEVPEAYKIILEYLK